MQFERSCLRKKYCSSLFFLRNCKKNCNKNANERWRVAIDETKKAVKWFRVKCHGICADWWLEKVEVLQFFNDSSNSMRLNWKFLLWSFLFFTRLSFTTKLLWVEKKAVEFFSKESSKLLWLFLSLFSCPFLHVTMHKYYFQSTFLSTFFLGWQNAKLVYNLKILSQKGVKKVSIKR